MGMPLKTLVHPGEVNRMREVPLHPHVLVTHTDSPSLYVWNTDTQPDRTGVKVRQGGLGTRGWGGVGRSEQGAAAWQARAAGNLLAVLATHRSRLQSTSSKQQSVADLVLEGHTEDAKFAVDVSSSAPLVASGGDDTKVGLAGGGHRASFISHPSFISHTGARPCTRMHLFSCLTAPATCTHASARAADVYPLLHTLRWGPEPCHFE